MTKAKKIEQAIEKNIINLSDKTVSYENSLHSVLSMAIEHAMLTGSNSVVNNVIVKLATTERRINGKQQPLLSNHMLNKLKHYLAFHTGFLSVNTDKDTMQKYPTLVNSGVKQGEQCSLQDLDKLLKGLELLRDWKMPKEMKPKKSLYELALAFYKSNLAKAEAKDLDDRDLKTFNLLIQSFNALSDLAE
ncbi:hypothetical protein [Oligella sp. HMSC09E12]|uniref:hypothetical protein n=1 Tax=Oligella sp. HMSC09E12 TaxID=1581147 RepID=UPI0008A1594B|nr:hypothetical protein [Oligella sp. HMSC09E12]OFV49713.1 hypothetical protein HMPREF3179_03640 [Oligella sp. HMSC09E12]